MKTDSSTNGNEGAFHSFQIGRLDETPVRNHLLTFVRKLEGNNNNNKVIVNKKREPA